MSKEIQVDLLKYQDQLKVRKEEGVVKVFCSIRKKYLVNGPEEVVRQLLIHYLIVEKGYSLNRIAVEKMLNINDRLKRFDVLVYDEQTAPQLLVECKAPNVKLTEDTFHQIANYNLVLKVKYLLVTNGIQTYCCKMDYLKHSFEFLPEVPSFAP